MRRGTCATSAPKKPRSRTYSGRTVTSRSKYARIKPDTHASYGKRTRLEFTCLKEDIDKSILNETLTLEIAQWSITALKDLAEELEWKDKKTNRVIVICSCPSQVCTPRMTTIHAGGGWVE